MNYDSIHAFLTVAECGNISNAAQKLYISQSNLSARLQTLEKEIGHPLLIRSKGHRSIELTSHGEKFLALARQMENIFLEVEQLRDEPERTPLTICLGDVNNTFTFVPFYQAFTKKHPEICLECHTAHSREVFANIESGRYDLGFSCSLYAGMNVRTTLLFEEPMFLLTSTESPYYNGIHPSQLPAELEIYHRFSAEYELWHNARWPLHRCRMRISTGAMAKDYLDDAGTWIISCASTCLQLSERYHFSVYSLSETPPARKCWMVESQIQKPSRQKAIAVFKEELAEFIRSNVNLDAKI
ncbi:MAG: LysR family transcriptional regulator [Solobacterium sp.]|nr:LysR family transcriptional regulator [Solobacterium sp.]